MSGMLILTGLSALLIGELTKYYLLRNWGRYYVPPSAIAVPLICPVCLSRADTTVEEESPERTTKDYVVYRKTKRWRFEVKYCSSCARRLSEGMGLGVALGIVSSAGAFILMRPSDFSLGVLVWYALFAYPAFTIFSMRPKGVVIRWASPKSALMRIKRAQYYDALVAANRGSATEDVPLADNAGVWRSRGAGGR